LPVVKNFEQDEDDVQNLEQSDQAPLVRTDVKLKILFKNFGIAFA